MSRETLRSLALVLGAAGVVAALFLACFEKTTQELPVVSVRAQKPAVRTRRTARLTTRRRWTGTAFCSREKSINATYPRAAAAMYARGR